MGTSLLLGGGYLLGIVAVIRIICTVCPKGLTNCRLLGRGNETREEMLTSGLEMGKRN